MSDMYDAMMYAAQAAAKYYMDRAIKNYIKSRYHTLCRCPEMIALKGYWGPTFVSGGIRGVSYMRLSIAPFFFSFPRALPTELKGIAV